MSDSSSSSSSSSLYVPPASHCFHASYSHPLLRTWQNEASPVNAAELMYPIFVSDDENENTEIKAMPGQFRVGLNHLDALISPLVAIGLRSVLLFGVVSSASSSKKDLAGSYAYSSSSPVVLALQLLSQKHPSLLLCVDVCLCAYTSHGHCGVMNEQGIINNQASIDTLAKMALSLAKAGARVIAPSDMMDGRVGAIKQALIKNSLSETVSVLSYSVKFASCMYGPFREAAQSGMTFGDRQSYQLPSGSRSLALRAAQRDVDEGADMLMVKPGLPYLDLVREVKDKHKLPVAVYHTSGEFAMLYHAAAAGSFNLETAVLEVMTSFKRAGATIIITYFTPFLLQLWAKKKNQS